MRTLATRLGLFSPFLLFFPLPFAVSLIGYVVLHVGDACTVTGYALFDLPPLTPFVQTSLRAARSQWTSLAIASGAALRESRDQLRLRDVRLLFAVLSVLWWEPSARFSLLAGEVWLDQSSSRAALAALSVS